MKALKIFYLISLVVVILIAIKYYNQVEVLVGSTILSLICLIGAKYSHELTKL